MTLYYVLWRGVIVLKEHAQKRDNKMLNNIKIET